VIVDDFKVWVCLVRLERQSCSRHLMHARIRNTCGNIYDAEYMAINRPTSQQSYHPLVGSLVWHDLGVF
jgi:hypothetical protein